MTTEIVKGMERSQGSVVEGRCVVTRDPQGEWVPGVCVAYTEEEAEEMGAWEEEGITLEDALLAAPWEE